MIHQPSGGARGMVSDIEIQARESRHAKDVVTEILATSTGKPKDQINTIHITSWTEAISTVWGLREFTLNGRYWETDMLYSDAIQVVNNRFFEHVFFGLEMGDAYMRRTDDFLTNWYPYLGDFRFKSKVPHPKVKSLIPLREQTRHFDAYWHVGVPFEYCPMLQIPAGFFDGKIEVTDYSKPEDFPLFWSQRFRGFPLTHPDYLRDKRMAVHNLNHHRVMIAPHDRNLQSPNARTPAIWPTKPS